MKRIILLFALVLALVLPTASVAAELPAKPDQSKLETRLSQARTLLAHSGITLPAQDDSGSIRNLKAAFENWISDPSGMETIVADDCFSDDTPPPPQNDLFTHELFLPTRPILLGRSLGLTLEFLDVADNYFVETENTATPEPGDTIVTTRRNSDDFTPKATFSFRPGDLYISTSDYAQAFLAMNKFSTDFPFNSTLATQKRALSNFERSIHRPQRLLNAVSLSLSLSRRPQDDVLKEDRTATTWGVKIDPYLYFNPLSARSSAYEGLLTYGKTIGGSGLALGNRQCDMREDADSPVLHACLVQLSRTSKKALLATAWLPTIEYQSVDQQDFLKFGQTLLRNDETSLWSVKLTMDLTRALGVGKAREQALAILKSDRDLRTGMPKIQTSSQLPNARLKSFYYQRLAADGGLKAFTWALEAPKGKKAKCALPGVELTPEGLLIGEPLRPGYYRLEIMVTDSLRRQAKSSFQVFVEGGRVTDLKRSLMQKYLDLAASSSLAEDDAWFEDLIATWKELAQEEPLRRSQEIAYSPQ
jgi:hypothetical protein